MPEIAAGTGHATLLAWILQPGDAFVAGDEIAELETDKATVGLPAEHPGVVGTHLLPAGREVEVGAPLAVLLDSADEVPDVEALLNGADENGETPRSGDAAPSPDPSRPRQFVSPLVRRLARDHGLDLTGVLGSGPGGRVVRRDVEGLLSVRTPAAGDVGAEPRGPLPQASPPPAIDDDRTDPRRVPHTRTRRTIAARLTESKTTVPHFYLTADLRVDPLLELRDRVNQASRDGQRISVNDFVVRAAALALTEVPEVNVAWTPDAMIRHEHADIAVAVDTGDGLLTPVVHSAETKPISTLHAEIADLASRARAGKLRPHEYAGGGFTISNLGMHGVPAFAAIINPPQAAILAVGATREAPIAVSGAVVAAKVMTCTLSVDHRAVDGAPAARWLACFTALVEDPVRILV
ncbi:2-oxo acid dehydrogenase subunit E2 [Yinghuangia aomiensis]